MKLNNKGRAGRLIMIGILIVALLSGWLYMRHLASTGKMDPEIVKVIEDPVGTAKEYVDAFNNNTQKRMDSLKNYG
jgi:hypothetical protein